MQLILQKYLLPAGTQVSYKMTANIRNVPSLPTEWGKERMHNPKFGSRDAGHDLLRDKKPYSHKMWNTSTVMSSFGCMNKLIPVQHGPQTPILLQVLFFVCAFYPLSVLRVTHHALANYQQASTLDTCSNFCVNGA